MVEIELWVLVDEAGDYGLGRDEESASESYSAEYTADGSSCRKVRVVLQVPFAVPTLTGTVPPEGEAALKVS